MSDKVLMVPVDEEKNTVWTRRVFAEKRLRKGQIRIVLSVDPPDLARDPDEPMDPKLGDEMLAKGENPYES